MRVILTGATGMAGEGVLLECLENSAVTAVLVVGRKHYDYSHPKLKELLVPDFMNIADFADQLTGYDACFYCAGISSVGMRKKSIRILLMLLLWSLPKLYLIKTLVLLSIILRVRVPIALKKVK